MSSAWRLLSLSGGGATITRTPARIEQAGFRAPRDTMEGS
jgi:hypothetical protein